MSFHNHGDRHFCETHFLSFEGPRGASLPVFAGPSILGIYPHLRQVYKCENSPTEMTDAMIEAGAAELRDYVMGDVGPDLMREIAAVVYEAMRAQATGPEFSSKNDASRA